MTDRVIVDYFSDVLCIWAHGARPRIEELSDSFPRQVEIRLRYIPVFGAAHARIRDGEEGSNPFHAFRERIGEVARKWPHVTLHPDTWRTIRPCSSLNAHIYLKAAQLTTSSFDALFSLDCAVRNAFFTKARDIGRREVLDALFAEQGMDLEAIHRHVDSGEAAAALCSDRQEGEGLGIPGSPTLVLNEGRQRLYGDVGYRLIEANVRELLHNPETGEASWC